MPVVILGAGGHGRVVAEAAHLAGLMPIGFLDDDQALHGTHVMGLPVLGGITRLEDDSLRRHGVVIGIGNNHLRQRLCDRVRTLERSLPVVVHPRAWVSPSAVLGPATVVMANATVQTGCQLGTAVIVNTNASVDHDNVLADAVHISPGAHLAGHVTIGAGTLIGIGAQVIECRNIGAHCLIAAGAAVVRDVPNGQRVAGVPARVMKQKDDG